MLKKFSVYSQYFLIITKYVSKLTYRKTVIACNKGNPSIKKARLYIRHRNRPGGGPFNIRAHY